MVSGKTGFGLGIRFAFRLEPQLISCELPATGTAAPLHMRKLQLTGRRLRLPRSRHFTMTYGADHSETLPSSVRKEGQPTPSLARLPLIEFRARPIQRGISLLLTGR